MCNKALLRAPGDLKSRLMMLLKEGAGGKEAAMEKSQILNIIPFYPNLTAF